ncbi:hypothetical protein ACPZ19_00885 [Amycolatopsis lurida]
MQDKLKETDLSRAEANPTERANVRVERFKVKGRARISAFGIFSSEVSAEVEAPDQGGNVGNAIVTAIVVGLTILACLGAVLVSAYVAAPPWVALGLVALIVGSATVLTCMRKPR